MSFADANRSCFSKYATFSGRARRSEYWYFALLVFIIQTVLGIVAAVVGAGFLAANQEALTAGTAEFPAALIAVLGVMAVVDVALLLPALAVTVRRLHDTDRSGGFFFLNFVPVVGPIIVFVFTLLEGTVGPNRFGADPKGAPVPTAPTPAAV